MEKRNINMSTISGFSKFSKEEKLNWLSEKLLSEADLKLLRSFWHQDRSTQKILDEFSENTLSNFCLPFGIAPNFKINNKVYHVPMVIEESSVVAAASKAAKFWSKRGGLKTKVIETTKVGQIHFFYAGETQKLFNFFNLKKSQLYAATEGLTRNMERRGGGIKDIRLEDRTSKMENYFLLHIDFETVDAMGANFINSVLEAVAECFKQLALDFEPFNESERNIDINMSILSNYTPECRVKAFVECSTEELSNLSTLPGTVFAKRFYSAVQIAKVNIDRAVTHNKGIMNGVDAVVLATGNDFRSIEAAAHAYAAKDGSYRGLSSCRIDNDNFYFELELPLALGTVGGLTSLHPLSKVALKMLGGPSAKELMEIIVSVGLAQNFGALSSLVTTGIQKGHMKMHLLNILNQLNANEQEVQKAKAFFKDKVVSYRLVQDFLETNKDYKKSLH